MEAEEPGPARGDTDGTTSPNPTSALAWVRHAAAPTARTEVAVAAVGPNVFAIGGFDGAGVATRAVEAYDALHERWSTAPDYPIPVHHSAAVAQGETVYVLGGYTTSAFVPTALAFKFSPGGQSWTPLANLPEARGAHAAASVAGKLYVAGGVGANGNLLTSVHVYDAKSDRWESAPDLPAPRDHLAAVALGGTFYVVGGRAQSLTSNTGVLEAFDPATETWTRHTDMPTPRGGITAASFGGRLVVAGGESPEGTFGEVEAFDPERDQWDRLPDLLTPRHGLGSAVVEGRFYVVLGGPRPGLTTSGAVESLGPQTS